MGFGLFFPGLGGHHQVQVDDALGQSLLVAADLAPAYQPGAGGRRPHAGAELLHGALVDVLDLADGALAGAGAAYLELGAGEDPDETEGNRACDQQGGGEQGHGRGRAGHRCVRAGMTRTSP